jgi:uncharacterized protein involved in exopolysaccharide biosynthesis
MSDSQSPHQQPPRKKEIGLNELLRIFWRGKWLIAAITAGAAVLAIVVSLMIPDIYRAEALLAPNDQQSASGLSALAAQFGGLTGLAGIDLAGNESDKTEQGLAILKSRKFLAEFVERRDILVPLLAATGWDPVSGELSINPASYDVREEKWVRKVSPPMLTIPSSQEAYERLARIMSVEQNKRTGFVTIAIEHYSPVVAKQWVDWLVEDLNASIMKQEVTEAEQAIQYLNQQIEKTSLANMHSVFFNLIEEQTKTVMLAKVSSEYLFKTLDPAVVPERKIKPKRSLIVIFTTFFGFLLAIALVLIRSSIGRRKNET